MGRLAELRLEGVGKAFGATWVVRDLALTVADGEFLALLGPSGCGKTTTLRIVAGFVQPTTGRVVLNERVLTSAADGTCVPPERRGMGMVFQSYAVWPHMTVFQNVAYPLRLRGIAPEEVTRRVRRALELVHLVPFADRYPHELSGGQQQRVALARALVAEPDILLLDEPLSNLDARLREEMRFEIRDLVERLGITVLYVTHDQTEALSLSDRIAVMQEGRIVQVGTPQEVYEHPVDPFVAAFLGAANFLLGEVVGREDGAVRVRLLDEAGGPELRISQDVSQDASGRVLVCVRPEAIALHPEGPLRGRVERCVYVGSHLDLQVRVGSLSLRVQLPAWERARVGEEVRLWVRQAVLYPATTLTTSSGVWAA